MKRKKLLTAALIVLALAVIVAFTVPITVSGPQAAPESGAPAYTESLRSTAIPPLPPEFGGAVEPVVADSKSWWPPTIVPPKGAPNVLLILTDDVGFGAPSTFGGLIPTPTLDRVAEMGLRYTQFHTTALCSPTRAALLTGRNHHSVGFGVISEMATGYPGYNSILPRDKATIGTILRDNGYATSWFGKDHNTPAYQASQAGPFDQWPVGMGFEYFYGFVGGDTSQWQPNLFRGTSPIHPYIDNPEWNLTTAMADEAIAHIKMLNETVPDRPFFVHYAPGGTHAPHHPTSSWIEKFKGKFAMGWNELREQIFANQKKLGVIPQDAVLTPWPHELPQWDSLSADEKKLFERQVEVYAAYLAYTDHEIGRVIQAVEDMGKLDDTLIIYISGDNGSSAEGSPIGTPNEVARFNSIEVPVAEQLERFYDDWGSDRTYGHMAVGWTWAFSTPYRWTKQVASHFGGTRNGVAIAWPKRIPDGGGIRHQFHHIIDVVPTILEAAGVTAPATVDGITQAPIEGTSMAYTWDEANAEAPTTHRTQYFEMFGNRGIYHEGWYANTRPISPPWNLGASPPKDVMNAYSWELYDLSKDWTQSNDLAASNPEKLKELQQVFLQEAEKYQVFPLDNSLAARMVTPRPSSAAGRNRFTYIRPLTGIPMGSAPSLIGTSYRVRAEVEVPEGGGNGMLVTQGGRFGGWGFYLRDGRPVYVWNVLNLERARWESPRALTPGKHTLDFEFNRNGTGVLKVDGSVVVTRRMGRTIPVTLQWDETFDVGSDTGTPVDDGDYQVPFEFNGKLSRLTVILDRPNVTSATEPE
jgi:arylsulfatase